MISIAPGSSPDRITRDTASPAACRMAYAASTVRYTAGRCTSRSVISRRDAEQTFRADEQTREVGSGVLEAVASKHDHGPIAREQP